MKKHELKKLVIDNIIYANSVNNLLERLNLSTNGAFNKTVKDIIKEENIVTSHFHRQPSKTKKYELIEKNCPVCDSIFTTKKGHKLEKVYCCVSCSNSDRITSDETRLKISEENSTNNRLKKLSDKYGENMLAFIHEMRENGSTYDDIKLKNTGITEDDLKIFCNIVSLNHPNNHIVALTLNKDDVLKLYLEHKNIRKVAEILDVSYPTIRKMIDDSKLIKRESNNTLSGYVVDWRKRKKIQLVEYKGGECQCCGYNKSVQALTFHHIDPKEKDFTISQSSYSFERLKSEVDKCLMLCSNCHIEVHEEIRQTGESKIVNDILNKK